VTTSGPLYPPVYFFAVGSAEILSDHPLAGGPPGSVLTEREYNADGKGSLRLTIDFDDNEAQDEIRLKVYMTPTQARNLAANLIAAATITESSLTQSPGPEPW
jgi:hypothetical protein